MTPTAPTGPAAGGTDPQLLRIARLLDVDVADLAALPGLQGVPAADLRVLHDQMSEAMHRGGRAGFAAVAGLAAKLPGPVAGRLAERFLPPVLAARVCEHLEPARARDLVTRVSVPYLAGVAVALDPVRSRAVVEAIPAERIGAVAEHLFAAGEHVAMSEFVGVIGAEALSAAIGAGSAEDLAAIVPLLEWTDRLEQALADLPDERLAELAAELDHPQVTALAERPATP